MYEFTLTDIRRLFLNGTHGHAGDECVSHGALLIKESGIGAGLYVVPGTPFVNHHADVFIVTVEPKPGAHTIYKNTHPGQEFNMVLEGKMELFIGGKTMILEEGDSIYFDSSKPHGMLAVGDKPVKFLAFTVE